MFVQGKLHGYDDLFSLGVQHFHEECLSGSTSSAVLQIKMVFTTSSHRMYFRNNTYQFCEFFLCTPHQTINIKRNKTKENINLKTHINNNCKLNASSAIWFEYSYRSFFEESKNKIKLKQSQQDPSIEFSISINVFALKKFDEIMVHTYLNWWITSKCII